MLLRHQINYLKRTKCSQLRKHMTPLKSFRRPSNMSIKNYIDEFEFERLLNKTKKYGTSMSADVLAYTFKICEFGRKSRTTY